jgi:hypothetical protein
MPKKMSVKVKNILSATMRAHVAKVRSTGNKNMTKATKGLLRSAMKMHNGKR